LVSNYLNDEVKVGQTMDVLPPRGHFKLTLDVNQKHNYYFFGAGSGITPLTSMISSILESEPNSRCHLLYGNRDEDNVIFHKKLDRMRLVYNDRFRLNYLLSRPKSDASKSFAGSGRVDKNSIAPFLERTNDSKQSIDGYFICGPGEMIENTYEALIDLQLNKEIIHREYFSAPISDEAIAAASTARPKVTANVKVKLGGKDLEITMDNDKNIVEALMDENVEPPYSCLSGTCSTCMAKLVKGKVAMDVSIGLEDDEKENGYILTCQSHPLTEELVVDYDGIEQ